MLNSSDYAKNYASTIGESLVPEEIAEPRFRNSLKGIVADSLNFASGGNEEELERQLEWNCLASLSSLPTFAVSGKTLLGPHRGWNHH